MSDERKQIEQGEDEPLTFVDVLRFIIKAVLVAFFIYAIPAMLNYLEYLWYTVESMQMGFY